MSQRQLLSALTAGGTAVFSSHEACLKLVDVTVSVYNSAIDWLIRERAYRGAIPKLLLVECNRVESEGDSFGQPLSRVQCPPQGQTELVAIWSPAETSSTTGTAVQAASYQPAANQLISTLFVDAGSADMTALMSESSSRLLIGPGSLDVDHARSSPTSRAESIRFSLKMAGRLGLLIAIYCTAAWCLQLPTEHDMTQSLVEDPPSFVEPNWY